MAQATAEQRSLPTSNSNMAGIIAELQPDLNALFSSNSGPNQPDSPVLGMVWLYTGVSPYQVRIYDGVQFVTIGTLDAGAHTFVPINAFVQGAVKGSTVVAFLASANGHSYGNTAAGSLLTRREADGTTYSGLSLSGTWQQCGNVNPPNNGSAGTGLWVKIA